MRIVHCIWTLGGGGAERQLSYLAPELARLGWDVHVTFAFGGGKYGGDLEKAEVTRHDLKASHRHDLRVPWRLARLLRSLQPDLVQTWLTQMDIIGAAGATFAGVPWILSERSNASAYPRSLLHSIRVLAGKRARGVVANSRGGIEYWKQFREERNFLVPNGIPFQEIAKSDERDAPDWTRQALLFVGRLSPEKNPGALLEALRMPELQSFRAVFCGSGPMEEELQRKIAEYGLQRRVILEGDVEKIWPYMKSASAVIALSRFEGLPNAVLEAAACRTPLVVSDIPAHRAMLRDSSALFVDPDDASAVSVAIRAVTRAGAQERIQAAFEDVNGMDVVSVALRYDQVYRSLISGE